MNNIHDHDSRNSDNNAQNHTQSSEKYFGPVTSKNTGFIDIKTIKKERFAELTGITKRAVDGKIARGTWRYGVEYIKDPDGNIHIILEGYNQWVLHSIKRSNVKHD